MSTSIECVTVELLQCLVQSHMNVSTSESPGKTLTFLILSYRFTPDHSTTLISFCSFIFHFSWKCGTLRQLHTIEHIRSEPAFPHYPLALCTTYIEWMQALSPLLPFILSFMLAIEPFETCGLLSILSYPATRKKLLLKTWPVTNYTVPKSPCSCLRYAFSILV